MSTVSLEERIEELETRFAELLAMLQAQPPGNGWRSIVGMFADDPQIEELHRETRRIRDEDRAETRDRSESRPE